MTVQGNEQREGALLVLDTGSPQVSVAVGAAGRILAARDVRIERSSTQILPLIDETLRAAGLRTASLAGVVALRGPGSFTGLRIGLATALGLHQALGLPAGAISTFQALAAAAPRRDAPLLAVVDALRGEWSAQLFPSGDPGDETEGPSLLTAAAIAELARSMAQPGAPLLVTGCGLEGLRAALPPPSEAETLELLEAGPLAEPAARWLSGRARWPLAGADSASLLSAPIYSRPPAVTLPRSSAAPISPAATASGAAGETRRS